MISRLDNLFLTFWLEIMGEFDDLVPYFAVAKNRWPDAPNLQEHYLSLRTAYEQNLNDLIEQTKSFLETVCITILNDLGEELPSNPNTTVYVKRTLEKMGISNQRGASAFDKVLSSLNKMADALTEVRNQAGGVAHGRDGFLDPIQKNHAVMYILAVNVILSVILEAFDGVPSNLLYTRDKYERFGFYHEKVDSNVAVEADVDSDDNTLVVSFLVGDLSYEMRVPPSQLLFSVDRQAYVDILASLQSFTEEQESGAEGGVSEEDVSDDGGVEEIESRPSIGLTHFELTDSYEGQFEDFKFGLYEHLASFEELSGADLTKLTYSILQAMDELVVPDWKQRLPVIARIRMAVKRIFRAAQIPVNNELSENVVLWLRENLPSNGSVIQ